MGQSPGTLQPTPEAIGALLEYYRPILGRRHERLSGIRAQSGTLIQTALTVLGLFLIILVVLPAGRGRVLAFWTALLVLILYSASIFAQLPIHATRTVTEMPNGGEVTRVQFESSAEQIRAAELETTLIELDRLKPTHAEAAEQYRIGFRLFQAGTLVIGVAVLIWIIAEVRI